MPSPAGVSRAMREPRARLQPFLPEVRDALAMSDLDPLGSALDGLATHLATSDGVVPVSSQIPSGGTWTTGTALSSAHSKQPSDPSAISQVLAQLNTWLGGGARCVLLLGPAFSDHRTWQAFLTQAESARPGAANVPPLLDLRLPPSHPPPAHLAP